LLALGFVLLTVGAAAAAVSLAFWKRRNRALLAFGAFAFIYGVALSFRSAVLHPLLGLSNQQAETVVWTVNYWLAVPALMYTDESRGPGWHLIIRRLWQGWIPLASFFTVYDFVAGKHGALMPVYMPLLLITLILVLIHVVRGPASSGDERRIRRIGSAIFVSSIIIDNMGVMFWPQMPFSLEPIGVTSFIGSLGFMTARQFFAHERELAVVEHEMQTARGIQESILPSGGVTLPKLNVAARYLPMRGIAGDLYDFQVIDEHRVGILVADVIGHGVPAALVASMVKIAFTSQRQETARPAALLTAMNEALCHNLTAQFVTAAYVYIDTEAGELRFSLAGHPPPILFRHSTGQRIDLVEGAGVFLGFDRYAKYHEASVRLTPGDRLLLYTDGLIEAQNAAGAFFGDTELRKVFTPGAPLTTEGFAAMLMDHLRAWAGLSSAAGFEDDLTIVVVVFTARGISGSEDFRTSGSLEIPEVNISGLQDLSTRLSDKS
jgi:sigma-B regulation protein RsbU (phosphoserine phosphatase)